MKHDISYYAQISVPEEVESTVFNYITNNNLTYAQVNAMFFHLLVKIEEELPIKE